MRYGEVTLRALLDPIQHLLDDPEITEIVVNKPGEVATERNGEWDWHEVSAFDFRTLDAIGILSGRANGREFDSEHPYCRGTLPDGQRIMNCRSPVTMSPDTIAMCIRKPPRNARRTTDEDFAGIFRNTNSQSAVEAARNDHLVHLFNENDWVNFWPAAVKARKTIGICGATGSGKTDLLRRFLCDVPSDRRIVTIESDPEFGAIGPRNRVALLYNEDHPRMTATAAVKAAKRLYPKSIWFQEVTGDEAYALTQALLSGHSGGGTSWHAERGKEIESLATMIRQTDEGKAIPDNRMDAYIKGCFDIIAWCAKGESGYEAPSVWFKAADEAAA